MSDQFIPESLALNPSIRVRDIIESMERWAPPALAYDWDRAGLSVGEPGAAVTRVVTCLTVTPEVAAAAREAGAEMIVSHHPLIWAPLRALRTDAPHTRLCLDLAASGIACYAAHTNLDLAPGGVNDVLAAQLGLQSPQPLLPVEHAGQVKLITFVPEAHLSSVRDALAAAGAGLIGAYSHCSFSTPGTGSFLPDATAKPFLGEVGRVNEEAEYRLEMLLPGARMATAAHALRGAHPYEEPAFDFVPLAGHDPRTGLGIAGDLESPLPLRAFAERVCTLLGATHVRLVGDPERRISRAGVIGGAGGDYAVQVAGKVDVLVTGDVKYHHALEALEQGVAVIDAGHGATEKAIAPAIARYLEAAFPALEVRALLEPEWFQVITVQS